MQFKLKNVVKTSRISAFWLIAGLALIIATNANGQLNMNLGKGCLTFDPDGLEVLGANRGSPHYPVPRFFFNTDASADIQRLSVRFSKKEDGFWERMSNVTDVPKPSCQHNDIIYDLVPIVDSGEDLCSVRQNSVLYQSVAEELHLKAVRIRCRTDTENHCGMYYTMPNDWEARVSLPQNMVPNWKEVAEEVRMFFDTNLAECN